MERGCGMEGGGGMEGGCGMESGWLRALPRRMKGPYTIGGAARDMMGLNFGICQMAGAGNMMEIAGTGYRIGTGHMMGMGHESEPGLGLLRAGPGG